MRHRLANIEDRQSIYELYMEESANPFLTYDPMNSDAFNSIFKALLDTGSLFVVENDAGLIGTYRLISKSDRQLHIAYLGSFTTRKVLQGKGFGKQILDHIKAYLIEQGKKRLELTVDVHNAPAISLYKKTDLEIEGLLRNNYRRSDTGQYYDEYIMAVLL